MSQDANGLLSVTSAVLGPDQMVGRRRAGVEGDAPLRGKLAAG